MMILILVIVFAYLLPAFCLWKSKKRATERYGYDLEMIDVITVILPVVNVLDLLSFSIYLLIVRKREKGYNKKIVKKFFGIKKVDE